MLIKTFSISNFRTFGRLELSDLERVNLIAGMNNVGKTALLEAFWQFSKPHQPRTILRLNSLRGIRETGSDDLSFHVFHRYNTSVPIDLIATGDWGTTTRSLRIELRPRDTSQIPLGDDEDQMEFSMLDDLPYEIVFQYVDETGEYESTGWLEGRQVVPDRWQTRFSSNLGGQQTSVRGHTRSQYFSARARNAPHQDADRLSRMEIRGLESSLVKSLRRVEPNLRRLTIISVNGRPTIHADVKVSRLIPIGLLGDGMQRMVSLALAFESAANGLMLIDEIENGIHYSKLTDLWRIILSSSEEHNTQVVATTHSRECMHAAHQVFSEARDYSFRYYRLDRVGEDIKVKTFDKELLDTAFGSSFEVR